MTLFAALLLGSCSQDWKLEAMFVSDAGMHRIKKEPTFFIVFLRRLIYDCTVF